MGFGVVGVDLERPAEGGDGVVELVLFEQGVSEMVVGGGEVGVEFESELIGGDGLVEQGFFVECFAEAVVELGSLGVEVDRFAVHLEGGVWLANLEGDHAEEVPGVWVLGLLGEDLAVDVFGFGQSAGLVVLDGELEGLVDCGGGCLFHEVRSRI